MERIRVKRAKNGDSRQIIFLIIDDTCCKKETSTNTFVKELYTFQKDKLD